MNQQELLEHFEYQAAIHDALTVALRALLKQAPEVCEQLRAYVELAPKQEPLRSASAITRDSFLTQLSRLAG
jgi:hypothetical protein